jgi:glycosyltransferase domain-containing protein
MIENNSLPKISVIIPTYNRPQLLKRAIESVLKQTYQNFEIIIIDGSPNDETEKIIKPYLSDSRIRYFHEPDVHTSTVKDRANIAKARNKAIKLAQGKYIAPLDDDDFWYDEKKLEKQIKFLEENTDYSLCAGGIIGIIQENPQKVIKVGTIYPEKDENIRKMILMPEGFMSSSVVFRKKDWETIGGYNEENPLGEDLDLYLRLGQLGKFYSFQEYFAAYTWGEFERGHITKYGRKCLLNHLKLIIKYRNKYPNFYKSFLITLFRYFYSFFPKFIRNWLIPIKLKIQNLWRKSFGVSEKEIV